MAAITNPVTRITDLPHLNKLMVTDYLPHEDKVKLIDDFPSVIGQIHVFDMNWRDIPGGIGGQVLLFNRLNKLKKIELRWNGDPFPLLDSPEFVPNPGVKRFVDSKGGTVIQKWDSWNIGPYFERILESHPDYDGRCIKNVFAIDDERVHEVLQTNPGLKIKLIMGHRDASNYGHLLQEERIRRMIVAFREVCEEFIDSLPYGMTFEAVRYLNIDENPLSDDKIEIMEQFLRRTPNIEVLSLRIIFNPDVNVNSVIRFICSIKKLRYLQLYVPSPSVHFKCLLESLLTSQQLPTPIDLHISYGRDTQEWIVSALKLNIAPAICGLSMVHESLEPARCLLEAKFSVWNRTMVIKNIEPRLVDTFNIFPYVKYINVLTTSDEYRRQCHMDLKTIRNHLPRNRAVTMKMSTVIRFVREKEEEKNQINQQ